ncbi:MAG TPA: protein kinase, partial [Kofleriaceae bacterium]|nr:protein kinase [Kofleriaceae bacterium]
MAARDADAGGARDGTEADGDRFVVLGKLGAGGMGVVYRAHDRLIGRDVALKTLKSTSGRDLYRFKREFRALCDLVHPNLCTLHELHTTGDEWFFTMELVEGVSFIDRVRPSRDREPAPDDDDEATRPGGRLPRTRAEVMEAPVDLGRLEDALGQLCDGLHALHAASKLHRDLKPSNVLCEASGRVVLLDFGLVADVDRVGIEQTHEHSAVGTPAYMSPEQAADAPLTAASDWYAVGAMLYEALTGRRPFEGKADEVMRRKQHELPPRPSVLASATPPHLDELCLSLLAPDPAARPDGVAILAALGRTPSTATAVVERSAGSARFVGREVQLATLEQALVASRQAGVAMFVRGSSGMGKSALVGRFLAGLRGRAVVLAGRCYQRESMPFKTLDALVDALTGFLLKLEAEQLAEVLPADVVALARLFPVLRRVPQIAEPEIRRFQMVDAQELRRRGFAALRELLAAVALRRQVVLSVDDLQWGDADSAVFLADLVTRADRPRALVLLVYRSEDEDSPVVATVQRRVAAGDASDVRRLDVAPLAADEARELVRELAPAGTRLEDRAEALLRDAGGNTLFLAELARGAGDDGRAASLGELLRRRIARLPPDARALLE